MMLYELVNVTFLLVRVFERTLKLHYVFIGSASLKFDRALIYSIGGRGVCPLPKLQMVVIY